MKKDHILIKCTCGKRFRISTWKHPFRKTVFCPFCRQPFQNSFFNKNYKPQPRKEPKPTQKLTKKEKIELQRLLNRLILAQARRQDEEKWKKVPETLS